MSKYLFILIILLSACQIEDLEPSNKAFYKIYGGENQEEGMDLLETDDGGFLVVGYTTSKNNGENKDVFIVKTNEFGVADWTRILLDTGAYDDQAVRVVRTLEDTENYLVIGSTAINQTDSTKSDIYVCKISVDNTLFWEKSYDTNVLTGATPITKRADFGVDIQLRLDGNYVVVGNSEFDDGKEIISFIINPEGDRIDDMFTFGLESDGDGEVNDVVNRVINNQNPLVSASGLIVGSSDVTQTSGDFDNVYVLYYSDNLTNISEFIFSASYDQRADDVTWALGGGYFALSTFNYDNSGFGNIQLLRVDGTNLRIRQDSISLIPRHLQYTNKSNQVTRGRALTRINNRYIIAAEYKESNTADSDILLLEVETNNNSATNELEYKVNWSQFYGGDNTDRINSVIVTRSGNIAFTGMLSFFDDDRVTKMILVKTDKNGKIVP